MIFGIWLQQVPSEHGLIMHKITESMFCMLDSLCLADLYCSKPLISVMFKRTNLDQMYRSLCKILVSTNFCYRFIIIFLMILILSQYKKNQIFKHQYSTIKILSKKYVWKIFVCQKRKRHTVLSTKALFRPKKKNVYGLYEKTKQVQQAKFSEVWVVL